MKHTYTIDEISYREAKNFLSAHHYLSQLGNGFIAIVSLGLFNEMYQLVGVQNWNHISAPETLVGAFGLPRDADQSRFLELTRLSMDDEKKERNLTSWFVARGLRYIKAKYNPRAVISYADSKYHCGYIYQATNWRYYGLSAPKKDFMVNGKIQQRGGGERQGGPLGGRATEASLRHRVRQRAGDEVAATALPEGAESRDAADRPRRIPAVAVRLPVRRIVDRLGKSQRRTTQMKITIEGEATEVADFVKAIAPSEVFVDSTDTVSTPIHLGEIPPGDGPLGTPVASETSPGPTTAS